MYHFFTIIYIALLGLKISLLKEFNVLQLGEKVFDIAVICGPALCLLVEFHWSSDVIAKRNQHRSLMQAFDMFLQLLFVVKVIVGLCRGDSGRSVVDFIKSRLSIGPSTYA
jgi:hypothetical protein